MKIVQYAIYMILGIQSIVYGAAAPERVTKGSGFGKGPIGKIIYYTKGNLQCSYDEVTAEIRCIRTVSNPNSKYSHDHYLSIEEDPKYFHILAVEHQKQEADDKAKALAALNATTAKSSHDAKAQIENNQKK